MAINNPKLNTEFKKLFKAFKDKYSELENLVENKGENQKNRIIPKELRLFRVRLLLVIGMKIDFDTTYSLTAIEKIEKTYIQIIKCCEARFAFEGLEKLADATDRKADNHLTVFSQDTFDNKFNTQNILRIYNDELKKWLNKETNNKRKEETQKYLTELESQMRANANFLKNNLNEFANSINNGDDVKDYNILAMIYATRNVFVHKGESAYFGQILYKNKHDFLEISYDYIMILMLKAIIYYCDKQISLHS